MKRISYLLSFIILAFNVARADYPAAKLNQHVCEEVKDQKDRLIPRKEWICASVDGQAYARTEGSRNFYHGVGHWTQVRTEVSWDKNVALNFRTIVFAGSSSNGYAEPTGNYTLASFKFTFPQKILGGTASIRAGDLDRQTVGAGLFIQERESNGGIVVWDFESAQFMFRQESTGYFMKDDDVSNPELSFFNKKVGVGSVIFYPPQDKLIMDHTRDPYHYLFTSFSLNEFDIGSEVGTRNGTVAAMGKVQKELYALGMTFQTGLQARMYKDGFAKDIERQIENQYVSYDQLNKAYTNTMSIFAYDDNVNVYAANFNILYEWSHTHRGGLYNEFASFAYKDIEQQVKNFYRLEYDYYPFSAREDHFAFFISNKILRQSQSYAKPPSQRATGSVPLFKKYDAAGIEARFRF